jgi:hypothetical protein
MRFRKHHQFPLAVDIGFQLPHLRFDGLGSLLQSAPAPTVLLQRHDPFQVGFRQTINVMGERHTRLALPFPSRLQFLRQPLPTLRSLQGLADGFGMQQEVREIRPDHCIELLHGNEAIATLLFTPRAAGMGFAHTGVVRVASARLSRASQLTTATTHQGAQQVGLRSIVATSKLLIGGEFGLHLLKRLLGDQGWNVPDHNPLVW